MNPKVYLCIAGLTLAACRAPEAGVVGVVAAEVLYADQIRVLVQADALSDAIKVASAAMPTAVFSEQVASGVYLFRSQEARVLSGNAGEVVVVSLDVQRAVESAKDHFAQISFALSCELDGIVAPDVYRFRSVALPNVDVLIRDALWLLRLPVDAKNVSWSTNAANAMFLADIVASIAPQDPMVGVIRGLAEYRLHRYEAAHECMQGADRQFVRRSTQGAVGALASLFAGKPGEGGEGGQRFMGVDKSRRIFYVIAMYARSLTEGALGNAIVANVYVAQGETAFRQQLPGTPGWDLFGTLTAEDWRSLQLDDDMIRWWPMLMAFRFEAQLSALVEFQPTQRSIEWGEWGVPRWMLSRVKDLSEVYDPRSEPATAWPGEMVTSTDSFMVSVAEYLKLMRAGGLEGVRARAALVKMGWHCLRGVVDELRTIDYKTIEGQMYASDLSRLLGEITACYLNNDLVEIDASKKLDPRKADHNARAVQVWRNAVIEKFPTAQSLTDDLKRRREIARSGGGS